MQKLLYTIPQAAELMSLSKSKVEVMVASKELVSIKIGRNRRIPAANIQSYIDSRLESAVNG